MAWNDITTLTSQNFKAGKVLGGLSPAKDLVCVEDIRIQSLLLHTGIHSRPHLIWPCTLSLPINYHSALTHLAQLCWLSYCCLNKPSSLLDQGPYCCYPPPSSSRLSTRMEPSLHSSLCSNCMSLRRSLWLFHLRGQTGPHSSIFLQALFFFTAFIFV